MGLGDLVLTLSQKLLYPPEPSPQTLVSEISSLCKQMDWTTLMVSSTKGSIFKHGLVPRTSEPQVSEDEL